MTKSIQLSGKALETAVELHDLYHAGCEEQRKLTEEYQRAMAQAQGNLSNQMNECWLRVLRAAGLPTAKPEDWGLDARYWPVHGLMFLNPNDMNTAEVDFELPEPRGLH